MIGTGGRMELEIIDKVTGKIADIEKIAKTEEWAKDLLYVDMEGFALTQFGDLILLDECGKYVYCPSNRFIVRLVDV